MNKYENNCLVFIILILAFFVIIITGYKRLFSERKVTENFENSDQIDLLNSKINELDEKFTNFTTGVNTSNEKYLNLDKVEPYVNEKFSNYTLHES